MDSKVAIVIGAVIFASLVIFFILIFLIQFQKKALNYKIEKQLLQSQFSQTLLQTQLEIQEQTLKTISQEIHDNIGQVLSLAKLYLATSASLEDEKVKESQLLVGKAIQDLRDLSRTLNADFVEEMGLLRSVEYDLEMINKTGLLKTSLFVNGHVCKLEQKKELILFRIVQESLHNCIKHANASLISVKFKYEKEWLLLSVIDDGIGFVDKEFMAFDDESLNAEKLKVNDLSLNIAKSKKYNSDVIKLDEKNKNSPAAFGLGIRNMNNRAKLLGATLEIKTKKDSGTEVIIRVPITKEEIC